MAFCSLFLVNLISIITEHSPLLWGFLSEPRHRTGMERHQPGQPALQLIITDDSRYQPSLSFPSLASWIRALLFLSTIATSSR